MISTAVRYPVKWCWSWSSNSLATWCWERLKAGGEGENRGQDGWMASPTQWTWFWASSGRWWRTGKPGLLQSSSIHSLSLVRLFATPWTTACQPAVYPWPTPRACSNSCPSSWWCHPTISSSVISFASCPQSFPASGSFPMSELFASGGQSRVSASASVLPMNIQDWSPLGLAGLISVQSKGLWRLFSNTTIQKHHFFSAQLSL